jgi:peptidylprolyl isomerase
VPTEKRQRQKDGQRARREAALAAARRRQRKRKFRTFAVLAAAIILISVVATTFGSNDKKDSAATTTSTASTLVEGTRALDPADAPTIDKPTAAAPTEKVDIKDLEVGDGAELKLGDRVELGYVGANYEAEVFESSWERGASDLFTIEEGSLIKGWIEGLPGMKVGGRRQITIPTSLAYGDAPPDESLAGPLIFVVELFEIE